MTQTDCDSDNNSNSGSRPARNSRTLITALVVLAGFVLILILFLYLVRRPALFGSFAQSGSETGSIGESNTSVVSSQSISYDNSYLFGSPLKAAASFEKVRVTAYILDGQGMGVSGKKVVLGNDNNGLQIFPISDITDDLGRAVFDVSANQAGLYLIEASVDGKSLGQRVTLSFE